MRFICATASLVIMALAINSPAEQAVRLKKFRSEQNTFRQQEDTITLYLTFDDGIANGSSNLLSIIDTCYIPVTVFVVGKMALKNDSTRLIWKKEQASPWIEVANHSYSHVNSRDFRYYSHLTEVLEDFRKNEDSLGLKNKLARLPGRNVWRLANDNRKNEITDSKAIEDTMAAIGYRLIGWDLEWNYSAIDLSLEPEDDFIFRMQQAIRYKRTFLPQHLVILCHDPALENPRSAARLIAFIKKINKTGNYKFRFLSSYPGVNH